MLQKAKNVATETKGGCIAVAARVDDGTMLTEIIKVLTQLLLKLTR